MSCYISDEWKHRGKNICGVALATAASATYIATGVFAHTAAKAAMAYAKYCSSPAKVVATPFGNMTCSDLKSLVDAESVLLPLFSWTAPIVACVTTVFIAHRIISGECCRKRGYSKIDSPPAYTEDY